MMMSNFELTKSLKPQIIIISRYNDKFSCFLIYKSKINQDSVIIKKIILIIDYLIFNDTVLIKLFRSRSSKEKCNIFFYCFFFQ